MLRCSLSNLALLAFTMSLLGCGHRSKALSRPVMRESAHQHFHVHVEGVAHDHQHSPAFAGGHVHAHQHAR